MRLGIDFGGTNIKTGIFSEDGKPVVFMENKLVEFTERGDLLDNLIANAKSVSENYELNSGGLAIKGLINTETGVLEDDIGAGALLAGKNLKEAFSRELNIPFKVENDARAYAWGEYKFGAGKGSKAMVCMTLGTGFGCAVIVDGKPFYGSDVLGGLLGGHISIDRNGNECPCGNRGCLELYCSATAFTKRVFDAYPEFENIDDILPAFFKKISNKEKKYFQTLYSFQDDLAIGVVNAIHAYGPDVVVLGGGVMNSAQFILPRLIELIHKRAWTFPRKKVQIKVSQLGSRAAAYGIAFLN
ncbi:MAG: ROK family protein [Ignavibacteriales bacterium]|nr:MAG: ROK family protein [Ignavibacteriales bacterium]